MTTISYYCSEDDVRRQIGLSSSAVSDADALEFIKLAQSEVDYITNSAYLIEQDSGSATSGDTTTVTDSGATWTDDEWNVTDDNGNYIEGYMVYIQKGTNAGECRVITDNSSTALTVTPAFSSAIDNTSKYVIFKNTYKDETFDGNGTNNIFTNWYPIFNIQSITIDSTSITLGGTSVYTYKKLGKIQLGSSAEKTTWLDSTPQLCNVKYFYGIYPIPLIVKQLTEVIAGLMIADYMIGNTYTFATSYTMPEMSVVKGVPYPHFAKAVEVLKAKRDFLLKQINAIKNPAFG